MTSDGTENGMTGSGADESVAAALSAWAAEPRLAAVLRGGSGCYIVLSGDAGRLLHASPSAKPLAAAIADGAGGVSSALRLADQLGRVGLRDTAPSLVRVQLDARRIAPPATCLLARGRLGDGAPVLLLAFDKPVTSRLRRLQAETPAVVAPEPPPVEPAPEPGFVAGGRFVWRSDAEGRLGEASGGPGPALREVIAGRPWASLAASGTLLNGEALLAALTAQRTFRAVPVSLALTRPERRLDLDISGAPLARAGRPFEGFAGFGLIRAVVENAVAPAEIVEPETPPATSTPLALSVSAAAAPPESIPDSVPAPPAVAEAAPTEMPEPSLAAAAPFLVSGAATAHFGRSWPHPDAEPTADFALSADPRAADPAPARPIAPPEPSSAPMAQATVEEADPAPSSGPADHVPVEVAAAPPEGEPSTDAEPLSSNEHAAFREIAKALGARFAGDDEEPADALAGSVAGFRPMGGSVTPFPTRAAEPTVDPASLLDGIPACLLVCRGATLLHANRRLLDLAGFPDLAALQAEGGLPRLFRGLPPQRHAGAVTTVAMATRDGGSRDTGIEQAGVTWLGEPAECLLVRPLPEGDAGRASAAAALADGFALTRAADAEAALDAVDDAVVSLDGAGRILSLNRAAAALFGCEPREVVGGGFADLFSPETGGTVRSLARAPAAGTQAVVTRAGGAARTRLLSLTPARSDGRRVAVLRDVPPARPSVAEKAAPAETSTAETSGFAARVGEELRAPVSGIVGSTDLILAERYGPLGDERYRGTVSDIRASGEQVLALVDDLVDLSRIEAGQRELAFGPLTLNDVVAECVAHLQPQAASGRVLLRTSFAADLAPVIADAPSLRQATLAVIGAAIRDTAAGGQVIVSTTQAERGEIALRVRDTGGGASAPEGEATLAQTGAAQARKAGAPGLGLPLTRALVEANHGRFRVSSRKDEGTLVEMLFSVREAALRA